MDHTSFVTASKGFVDNIRKNEQEDVFVFHSTLDINNAFFKIDDKDADIFEFLIEDAQKSEVLNLMIQTRGGSYSSAIEIHKILRDKYKTIKVIVVNTAMSCGTFLSTAADELFLHNNCNLGAFDPQVKLFGNYPPTGLHSFLKSLNINSKGADLNAIKQFPSNLSNLILNGHNDYYLIEDYIVQALTKSALVNNQDIQKILDRFYKDDHTDYVHHGKRIDFGYYRTYVPNVKPMALHDEYGSITDLFFLCEDLINSYALSRIYILNGKYYFR